MLKYLFKTPLKMDKTTATNIVQQLFSRFAAYATASEGEILTRIATAIRNYFATVRRSRISEDSKVTRNEGPSSTKMNQLFMDMAGDMSDCYTQQNSIDESLVEVHNFIDIRKESIKTDLKRASQNIKELTSLATHLEAGALIFEDSFDTTDKADLEFVTTYDKADIDTVAGVVTLNGERISVPVEKVSSKDVTISFDGEQIRLGFGNNDNRYSDGKLYGDPRDLGENGIRIGRESIIRVLEFYKSKYKDDIHRGDNGTKGTGSEIIGTDPSIVTKGSEGKADRRGSISPDGTVTNTSRKPRLKDLDSALLNQFPNPFN